MSRNGPIDHERTRAYSTVFSVPTTAGRVWFKAAAPGTAFEIPLYLLLRQLAPQHALAAIATDPDRAWLLLPDGGEPLADSLTGPALAEALVAHLPRYAQMQRHLAAHVAELLAIGVPDMRPAAMPARLDQALEIVQPYVEQHGNHTERATYDSAAALRPRFSAWADHLAASPVPPSLDHSDLHPGNILLPAAQSGTVLDAVNPEGTITFDWGTSVVAHPFTGLLIPLRFVQRELRLSGDDPMVDRVRDAYLEMFTDLAPRAELLATLDSASQMGKVVRALLLASEARTSARRNHKPRQQAIQWLGFLLDSSYSTASRRREAADRPRRRSPQLTAAAEKARPATESAADRTGPATSPGSESLAARPGSAAWSSSDWRADALAWVDTQLAVASIFRSGPVEHAQIQSRSAVFAVPTSQGRVWFKAAAPVTAFEVPLSLLLKRVAPKYALAPIAADTERGWLLLPDGGEPLADSLTGPALADALAAFLPRYARMQRDLAQHAADLLATGLPDMRPAVMPERLDEALDLIRPYVERHGHPGERATHDAVAALRSAFSAWSERLAASPAPPSLDHSDIQPGSILVPGISPGAAPDAASLDRGLLFDWGTSVLAHPFTSLLIPLRFVQQTHRVEPNHAEVQRARDAYLEVFSDLAPRSELVATVDLALQMGKVHRALDWLLIANEAGKQQGGQIRRALAWLRLLLDEPGPQPE